MTCHFISVYIFVYHHISMNQHNISTHSCSFGLFANKHCTDNTLSVWPPPLNSQYHDHIHCFCRTRRALHTNNNFDSQINWSSIQRGKCCCVLHLKNLYRKNPMSLFLLKYSVLLCPVLFMFKVFFRLIL